MKSAHLLRSLGLMIILTLYLFSVSACDISDETPSGTEAITEPQESKITEDMVPSPANLTGMGDGKLFVEIDGEIYRYSRTDERPSQYKRGDELVSFTYKPLYYPSQYEPDTITVYKLVGVDLNKLLVWYNNGQSDSRTYIYEYAPPQACPSYVLEDAKRDGYTVTEGLFVTHGADELHDFYDKTSSGVPTELKLAKYYTIGKNLSEELYEATKEDYPQIYYFSVKYDGKVFTVGQEKEYKYIHKFTEVFPEHAANPGKAYNVYALTNENVTWQDIQYGFFSSQLGSYIDHFVLIYEFVEE